ncbi:MAG: hypothetical protein LBE01_04190, partial [Deltaproteobacteria bacterium]|nr:hypothetical protein [Deltaproteobacteria bacterium]
MSQKPAAQAPDPPEVLAQSILRLPQLVKIHQPNNKIFVEYLVALRNSLKSLWSSKGKIELRHHRGRLYLNKTKIAFSPAMAVTAAKLMEFFESRKIFGFSFAPKEDLSNEDIVSFIQTI